MRYYVMEPAGGTVLLPTAPKGEDTDVVLASDLSRFSGIDYDARSELISERLKLLIEQFMPEYDFEPIVYYDRTKDEQMVFWWFSPALYTDYQATFRNDGAVLHIDFSHNHAPIVFTAQSPRGIRSIVVRMAVVESALRRSILGLKFTKVNKC